ncbi:putative signal peptide protein [Cylindrospermum sp. NIES-4074]|nr:putative signal peptide protein [Cylindrospermum sp. NIES-4074]
MKYQAIFSSTMARLFFGGAISLLGAKAIAAVTYSVWPSSTTVVTADGSNQFGGNLSGLFYEPAAGTQQAVLWGVQNSPSKLYNLVWNSTSNTFVNLEAIAWVPDTYLVANQFIDESTNQPHNPKTLLNKGFRLPSNFLR